MWKKLKILFLVLISLILLSWNPVQDTIKPNYKKNLKSIKQDLKLIRMKLDSIKNENSDSINDCRFSFNPESNNRQR